MRPFGFSTGALARGDFRAGIEMQRHSGTKAIELSALRAQELAPLLQSMADLKLGTFQYVSFHAPSVLNGVGEREVISRLRELPPAWPIIVHPDVICEPDRWRFLGSRLCLENMDQRKPVGRTVSEMDLFFRSLPDATFCFDIGHARQVDPTMGVAMGLLQRFRGRLRQVHISEVDPRGKHIPIGFTALCAFRRVAKLIPGDCPVIIESVVGLREMQKELETAGRALSGEELVENRPVASR